MSSKKDTTYYMELQPGDAVQDGDQWLDSFGQWQPYVCKDQISGVVFCGVKARRPIPTTHQTTDEEVPGRRTTQETVYQPQREQIAYEELQPGDIIQDGDEWQNEFGRWRPFLVLAGSRVQVRQNQRVRRPIETAQQAIDPPQRERIAYEELQPGTEVQPGDQYRNTQGRWVEYSMDTSGVPIVGPTAMARRPYKISTILEIGDALANAQKAATQLQAERDEARLAVAQVKAEFNTQAEVLAEVRADEKRLFDDLELLRGEYMKLQSERDELRVEIQNLLRTITDNADQFANTGEILEHERDEARAERDRLQEVVNNLYDEPTARQVQDMLRTWATELDWSAGCFDSVAREQIDTIQKTLVAVIERIEGIVNPEGDTDGE